MSLQPHSAVILAKRNIMERATKYVIYANIGGVESLIKGKLCSWGGGTLDKHGALKVVFQ